MPAQDPEFQEMVLVVNPDLQENPHHQLLYPNCFNVIVHMIWTLYGTPNTLATSCNISFTNYCDRLIPWLLYHLQGKVNEINRKLKSKKIGDPDSDVESEGTLEDLAMGSKYMI